MHLLQMVTDSQPYLKSSNKILINFQDPVMQSYPARALDRRLQENWATDAREGLKFLMSLRVDFGLMG